jgi:hypothetical protein
MREIRINDKIRAIFIDPFEGREHLVFCEGMGPDDPKCLEKIPPEGKQMIYGHGCGLGVPRHGVCKAVFADPKEHPDLFEII